MNSLKNIYKIEQENNWKSYTNRKNRNYKKCRISYIMKSTTLSS